jgi:hypothetical protein
MKGRNAYIDCNTVLFRHKQLLNDGLVKKYRMGYNTEVVAPHSGNGREVNAMDLLASFLISVFAGVVASYIYEWLRGDKRGNDSE